MAGYGEPQDAGLAQGMRQLDISAQGQGGRSRRKARYLIDDSINERGGPSLAQSAAQAQANAQGQWQPVNAAAGAPGGTQYAPQAQQPAQPRTGQPQAPGLPQQAAAPSDFDDDDQMREFYRSNPFFTNKPAVANPPADVDFVAFDEGSANPKILRPSLTLVPSSEEALLSTSLPFSVVAQPFAPLRPEETQVPLLDVTNAAPVRCSRCLGFVAPRTQFVSGGGRFKCHLCSFVNQAPSEYYAPTDYAGLRQDIDVRPELRLGVVDYDVGPDFHAKRAKAPAQSVEPSPLHILFAIDVSHQALYRGITRAATEAIRQTLYGGDGPKLNPAAKIGIVTFDRAVQFYNLSVADSTLTQMSQVADLDDMYVPFIEGIFVDPQAHRTIVETTLTTIATSFERDGGVPEPALGALTRAAYLALEATGGKLSLFLSALPTWGPHKLSMRENSALYGAQEEKTLFDSAHVHWKNVAEEFVGCGVGIDCFILPQAYVDVATVSTLSTITGGDTFYYSNFIADRDSERLAADVRHSVTREQAHSVLMKLRCSDKVSVYNILGNCVTRSPSDLEMGVLHADEAVTFQLKIEGKLPPQSFVDLQLATLCTTTDGRRRLRVVNYTLPTTPDLALVLRTADLGVVMATVAKKCSFDVHRKSLKEIKQSITTQCVQTLTAFRRLAPDAGGDRDSLIMPESLRLLPVMSLALQKQPAFRTDAVNSDLRTYNARLLRAISVRELVFLLYPRIYLLQELQPDECFPSVFEPPADGMDDAQRPMIEDNLLVPRAARATFGGLPAGTACVMTNGQSLLIWLRNDVSPALVQDLYGSEHSGALEHLDPMALRKLPELETVLNCQVRNLVSWLDNFLPARSLTYPVLARQGLDGAEVSFAQALVEDRNADAQDTAQYLQTVHREIQRNLREHRINSPAPGTGAGAGAGAGFGLNPQRWVAGADGFL